MNELRGVDSCGARGKQPAYPVRRIALAMVSGEATGLARYVSSSTNAKSFQKRDFFYVQDTWQATPNLTVNYGIRYEFYFPETVNGPGQGSLLNLATGYLNVGSVGNIPSNMGDGRDTGAGVCHGR